MKTCKECKFSQSLEDAGWSFEVSGKPMSGLTPFIECSKHGFEDSEGNIEAPDWYPEYHSCELFQSKT